MEWITDPQALIALLTLSVLEIVLGIDNIVFISILSSKLPQHQQARARMIGLALAMFGRIVLLLSLVWIMRLTEPLSTLVPAFTVKSLAAPVTPSTRNVSLAAGP